MMRQLSYLKAIVIVHGKSEKQMCDFIKSKLRIKIEIISEKKGEKSIQITSVDKILNNRRFKMQGNFIKEFSDVQTINGKALLPDFKIFIIMDTDDCTNAQKNSFINKSKFEAHWAYKHIVPIYNSPNLECVLEAAQIRFSKQNDQRKQEYVKIFPTDNKYKHSDEIQIADFESNLRAAEGTNMHEFVKFCLDIS